MKPSQIILPLVCGLIGGGYALDRGTDSSLQISHMRNLDTAQKRRSVVLQIRRHFNTPVLEGIGSLSPTSGEESDEALIQVINQETGFPTSIGIEALVSQPLPQILDNPLAQIASESCQEIQKTCRDVTTGQCLKPHTSSTQIDTIKNMMDDKYHYSSIRDCSINVAKCENDLVECIQKNVVSQCQKCRSME